MSFILLPDFEVVSQSYVGFELGEVRFSDEEVLFLYISLLREFVGSSEFLSYFHWQDFIFGQEHVLGNKCLFVLDGSNSLQKKASNVSIAFWTLKKRLLGSSELQKLYLFTSDGLSLYWTRLSSIVLLRGRGECSVGVGSVAGGGDGGSPIYKWVEQITFPETGQKRSGGGQFKEHKVTENISICFAMVSLFILTQFIFLGQPVATHSTEFPSNMYSKESYIAIVKFFQRNLTTLIRIISLFTHDKHESGSSSVNSNVPAPFEIFFNKVLTCDHDSEQDEHENRNTSLNAMGEGERKERHSSYKSQKAGGGGKRGVRDSSIAISEFTIDAFNYHIVTGSSGEIQLCIFLNDCSRIIDRYILDDYYLINNARGKDASERISYFLSSKVVHSINLGTQEELKSSSNEEKQSIFEVNPENEEVIHFEEARNVIVSNSCNLDLYVTRPVEYLFIRDCSNCNIYCLDLIANIHIESCRDCFIHIDCMFATLVNCSQISIFLHSQFSPVLKNSEKITIGPYNVSCLNRKTSYITSYENNLLTQNWKFPISSLSSFSIIKPEKLFIVELLDTKHKVRAKTEELPKLPLPPGFYENLTKRMQILELVRSLDLSSREDVTNQFASWLCDN